MTITYTPVTWTDELLAGDERYVIKTDTGVPIYSDVQIDLTTPVAIPATPISAGALNHIETGIATLDTKVSGMEYTATNKVTIVDADKIAIGDSVDGLYKHILFSLLKSAIQTAWKDIAGKFAGLTGFRLNMYNDAGTFLSTLANQNTTARAYTFKDRTSFVTNWMNNFSVAAQAITAATRTYITGSMITVPAGKLEIGTILAWRFNMTKTAAGLAASTFDICFGTNGTTADIARVSFTKPAGTAVVDEAWVEITCIIRGPLSAAGIAAGNFTMTHNLAATGHAIIPCVTVQTISAGFDVTTANLRVGVCITSGAADAITIQQVTAEAKNL